jgi:RNA polymerase sigma-70 factor (ECF subfamily)
MTATKARKSNGAAHIDYRSAERTVDFDDPRFVGRLRAGDPTAYDLLVRRLHPAMVRFAAVITGDVSRAEEVVQETWIALHTGIMRFEARCRLTTWIYTIVKNRARTRARYERRYVRMSSLMTLLSDETKSAGFGHDPQNLESIEATLLCDSMDPEHVVSDRELLHATQILMERLPERQRDVLRMRGLDGLDSAEVQVRLGISAENERILLHRARRSLRAGCPDLARDGFA